MKLINYGLLFACITIPFCIIMDVKIVVSRAELIRQAKEVMIEEYGQQEQLRYGE